MSIAITDMEERNKIIEIMKYIFILISLISFFGCFNKTNTTKDITILNPPTRTLELKINFNDSLNISKGFDVINWDTIKYDFEDENPKYLLNLSYKDSLSYRIQIPLVAVDIPFLFQFNRINQNKVYVNAIQQFNTVWGDSLVFEKQNNKYVIKEAFRRCYRGNAETFSLKIIKNDNLIILE